MSQATLQGRISALHHVFVSTLNNGQSLLLLAVRLCWGWQFAQTGWGKLHNIAHVTEFFASLGLPQPHFTAIFVSLVEFLGGIFLALGLFSRVTGLVLFINMSVAYWTADHAALAAIFTDPGKFTAADPFTFWFASLLVLIFGPGFFAIDTLLRRLLIRES